MLSWSNFLGETATIPPLLALTWDVRDELLLQTSPITLDADDRDGATLFVANGTSITYRLVALVYFNGSHYITVGRGSADAFTESTEWLCWDGMHAGGVGCPLQGPPTGKLGELRARSGKDWASYVPTVVIYCRVPNGHGSSIAGGKRIVAYSPAGVSALSPDRQHHHKRSSKGRSLA